MHTELSAVIPANAGTQGVGAPVSEMPRVQASAMRMIRRHKIPG